jgi:hypothetical protein
MNDNAAGTASHEGSAFFVVGNNSNSGANHSDAFSNLYIADTAPFVEEWLIHTHDNMLLILYSFHSILQDPLNLKLIFFDLKAYQASGLSGQ